MAPSLVQALPGGTYTDYGIGTTLISTTAGNALVVFAGWDVSFTLTNASVPAVNVTDSAGNLWRQAGISSPLGYGARGAIWYCPNAEAVSWVSVSLTGFASSTAWWVAEISTPPAALSLDFSVSAFNGFSTSLSVTGVSSVTDVLFTMLAFGSTVPSVTSAPSGFTQIGSTEYIGGSNPNGVAVWAGWKTSATAGSQTAAWTITTAGAPVAGLLVGIAATAPVPALQNTNFPLVVTEAAFGATPGNYSKSADWTNSGGEYITWTDISSRVIGDALDGRISASRGRQYELTQEESGECSIWLRNNDGAFTPSNPASPYYSTAINSNMSFQSGIPPWTAVNNAILAKSSTFAYASGNAANATYSLKVTPNGSTAGPGAVSEQDTVTVNSVYSASAWFYVPAGWPTGAQVNISWYTSGGSPISTTSGTVTPVPAGVWTQVTNLNVTPPATSALAAITVELTGTPSAGTVFYVAEAALAPGATAVATGLILPQTPLRITAWWGGRQYAIWMGYAERWPQTWPDMPQYGFSQVTATDAIAVASAANMQSALIGEVLIDAPYVYLPCNEQYTTATVGAVQGSPVFFGNDPYYEPADANGLIAVNYATGNQTPGVYADGFINDVATGLSANLLGDNGTIMGDVSYSAQDSGPDRGPAMFYYDPGLPGTSPNGFTTEFWFTWDNAGTHTTCNLFTLYGPPTNYLVSAGTPVTNGAFFGIEAGMNSGSGSAATLSFILCDGSNPTTAITASSSPQQAAVTFSGTTVTGYVNGVNVFTNTLAVTLNFQAVNLGPGRYSYDCGGAPAVYTGYNYAAGHLAAYAYQMSPTRISSHYTTGAFGQQGVSAAQRFAQVLTWGRVGLKRGGYWWKSASATNTPEITAIGPAYDLTGSSAADAINKLTQEEGGQAFVTANGSYVYLERWINYNQSIAATFGDNGTSEIPFLKDTDWDYDNTYLYSETQVTQQNGPNQLIIADNRNLASQNQFFRRSALTFTSEAVSAYDVSDLATWSVNKHAQPTLHLTSLVVNAASAPSLTFPTVLQLDIGNVIQVTRRPVGGAVLTELGIIERVQHEIGAGFWKVTYQISPYIPDNSVLSADTAGFDTPSTTTLGW